MADHPISAPNVRTLNDRLRTSGIGGSVVFSAGLESLQQNILVQVLAAVKGFDAFTPDNDPYGEHDCATLLVAGRLIIWKIDYFDLTLTGHSPDKANPSLTRRVLTIMLADEY